MQAVVVYTGKPDWAAKLETWLVEGFELRHYAAPAHYLERLADDYAALVLVDGDDPNWQFWTTTPKTSPATRRIPVVLVAQAEATRRAAFGHGADFALAPDELPGRLPALLNDYARVQDPARAAELQQQCQQALPPLATAGIEKFNAGEYYPQHDLFEEQWVLEPGPVRDLYRAILQVGVAYYQVERGNLRGARKMLLRSVQWLLALPDVCQGVDVRQLRQDAFAVRAALEAIDNLDDFDHALLKPVQLVEQSAE